MMEEDYEKLKKTIYGDNYKKVKDGKPFVHLAKSKSTGKILIQIGDELGTVTGVREAFKIAYRLLDMVYDKIRQDEK